MSFHFSGYPVMVLWTLKSTPHLLFFAVVGVPHQRSALNAELIISAHTYPINEQHYFFRRRWCSSPTTSAQRRFIFSYTTSKHVDIFSVTTPTTGIFFAALISG
jgi:hypothetical protein